MKYNNYDVECIVYLALQIENITSEIHDKMLKGFYIDEYYKRIEEIYEDYKQYDNTNTSLLGSINKYINNRQEYIVEKLNGIFE